jgi:hypothetical protein
MKRFVNFVLLMAAAAGICAQAQTACSVSSPCVGLTWTNAAMAATVGTTPGGVQTSGPGTAILWKCMGGLSSTCTQAALSAMIALETPANLCPTSSSSVWSCATLAQTQPNGAYNDPEPYTALMNYAVQDAWSGGGASAATPIYTFQMPAAPQLVAPVPGSVNGTLVTSGTAGAQSH